MERIHVVAAELPGELPHGAERVMRPPVAAIEPRYVAEPHPCHLHDESESREGDDGP